MKCKDCEFMWCRQFYIKQEQLTDYCSKTHQRVDGETACKWVQEPTLF